MQALMLTLRRFRYRLMVIAEAWQQYGLDLRGAWFFYKGATGGR